MKMQKSILFLVVVPIVIWEGQVFCANLRGMAWNYTAAVEPNVGMPINVDIEIIFLDLEKNQAEVGIVRTPWQTEVKVLYAFSWPSECEPCQALNMFETMVTKPLKMDIVCTWCWPETLFEVLPLLDTPFPYFSRLLPLLAALPFSVDEDGAHGITIKFSAVGPIRLHTINFEIDITVGDRTFLLTPLGELSLLSVQFRAANVDNYVFTTWCLPRDFPTPWFAPVKGEGRVESAGVVTTKFRWELVAFEKLDSSAIKQRLKQALEEMSQTAQGKAEDVRKNLEDLGIDLSL